MGRRPARTIWSDPAESAEEQCKVGRRISSDRAVFYEKFAAVNDDLSLGLRFSELILHPFSIRTVNEFSTLCIRGFNGRTDAAI